VEKDGGVDALSSKRSVEVWGMGAPSLPLSRAVIAGSFAFVSGQGPFHPKTKEVPEHFQDQARLTLENVERVLQAAGAGLADVVKVNVYLADLANFPLFNDVYREFFPQDFPARTTIGAALLGIEVEIECVARLLKENRS
jgi:2-iminobutanoate/2-iminopropanoate deaminase